MSSDVAPPREGTVTDQQRRVDPEVGATPAAPVDRTSEPATPTTDPDGFLRDMEAYAALGVTLVTMAPPTPDPVAWASGMAESIVPRMKQIG